MYLAVSQAAKRKVAQTMEQIGAPGDYCTLLLNLHPRRTFAVVSLGLRLTIEAGVLKARASCPLIIPSHEIRRSTSHTLLASASSSTCAAIRASNLALLNSIRPSNSTALQFLRCDTNSSIYEPRDIQRRLNPPIMKYTRSIP